MKLLLLGAGFVFGVLLADAVRPGRLSVTVAGWAAALVLVGVWALHRRYADPQEGELLHRLRSLPALLLVVGAILLGFADLGARMVRLDASPLRGLDGRVLQLRAKLAGDPQPAGRSWMFPIGSIREETGRELPGRLLVRSYGEMPAGSLGDVVQLDVRIEGLDPQDPFDLAQLRRGHFAAAALLSEVKILEQPANPLVRASNVFRDRMSSGARRAIPANQAALLLGLTIGDDRALSPQVRDDFRASGLSHLTAVSGANVAMVLGALAVLLQALRVSKRGRIVAGLLAVVLFAVVTRWEPSVLRASVMASAALAAFLFARRSASLHILGIAFLGLLVFDPGLLWSVGFQLSFAATLGILVLKQPLGERLGFLPRVVMEPVSLGLAAQAAVFPLLAVHFDKVSLASIPANLAGAGLVPPATILGMAGGVVSVATPAGSGLLFKVAGLFAGGLESVARTFGRSPVSQVVVPYFAGAELASAVLGLFALWLWLGRRRRAATWAASAAMVVVLLALVVPGAGSSPPGLRVTFFDVGQGDAALVESPGGARVLIDGGPDPELVADTLVRRGIRRIDAVVASHLHADHIVGLEAVLSRLDVGLALYPGVGRELGRLVLEPVGEGERLVIGDLVVEFLGPGPPAREAAEVDETVPAREGPEINDASVVLRVLWGGECVLFTGDLEEGGQQTLTDRHRGDIDCAVLKAPHHGSGKVLHGFVGAVDPELVVVSVGRNDYGHPSPKALRIFDAAGAHVLRTDRLDDVVVEIDERGSVEVTG